MIKFTTDYSEKEIRKLCVNDKMRSTRNWSSYPQLILGMFAAFMMAGCFHTWKLDFYFPLGLACVLLILSNRLVNRILFNMLYQDTHESAMKVEYRVEEDGIHCIGTTQVSHLSWPYIQKAEIMGDFFCFRCREDFRIFCRISQLSAEDFAALQEMAAAYIKTN